MPSVASIFNSSKKIFAHYFSPFPLSLDNQTPASDYYNTQYLSKNGESGKWLSQGGYLRQRPLGTDKSTDSLWKQKNMETEVSTAIARGVSGFTFDVLTADQATNTNSEFHQMLRAAQAVDSRFKIIVMPDITALKGDMTAVIELIRAAAASPAAYRLADGRLVVSAFDASLNTVRWWENVIGQLNAKGIEIAFVPTFVGWRDAAAEFVHISYGFGNWGSATVGGALGEVKDAAFSHSEYNRMFMTPVDTQQYRPKDFTYWEAANSGALRAAWMNGIKGGADWAQLVTWNDLSESGEISPYTDATLRRDIGTGYYDLNGFYASWFITGKQPVITHDVLYYFYRREPTNAEGREQKSLDTVETGTPANSIELVAFLTAPGVLKITIDGQVHTQSAAAGIVTMTVPTKPGVPLFTLSRNGADVFSFEGGVQIYGTAGLPSGLLDMTYWSGSAAKSGICSL